MFIFGQNIISDVSLCRKSFKNVFFLQYSRREKPGCFIVLALLMYALFIVFFSPFYCCLWVEFPLFFSVIDLVSKTRKDIVIQEFDVRLFFYFYLRAAAQFFRFYFSRIFLIHKKRMSVWTSWKLASCVTQDAFLWFIKDMYYSLKDPWSCQISLHLLFFSCYLHLKLTRD